MPFYLFHGWSPMDSSYDKFFSITTRQRFFIALIAMNILLAAFARSHAEQTTGEKTRSATSKPKVRLVAVERREQRRAVEAVGSLLAYDEVTVSAEVEGRVERVMVDVGDRVSKGQVLASISPVELQLTVD